MQQGLLAIASGLTKKRSPVERGLFYLPVAHAEDRHVQRPGVALTHTNTLSAPRELRADRMQPSTASFTVTSSADAGAFHTAMQHQAAPQPHNKLPT